MEFLLVGVKGAACQVLVFDLQTVVLPCLPMVLRHVGCAGVQCVSGFSFKVKCLIGCVLHKFFIVFFLSCFNQEAGGGGLYGRVDELLFECGIWFLMMQADV